MSTIFIDAQSHEVKFDTSKRMITIMRKRGSLPAVTYGYAHILQVDLVDDRKVVTKSKAKTGSLIGRSIVGGALFGGMGALVGAATAKTSSTSTTSGDRWTVRVIIDKISNPVISIVCDGFLGHGKETAERLYAMFQNVIANTTVEDMEYRNSYRPYCSPVAVRNARKKKRSNLIAGIVFGLLILAIPVALTIDFRTNSNSTGTSKNSFQGMITSTESRTTATPTQTPKPIYAIVTKPCSLRVSPDVNAESVVKVKKGDNLLVIEELSSVGWHKVKYKGSASYLQANNCRIPEGQTDALDNGTIPTKPLEVTAKALVSEANANHAKADEKYKYKYLMIKGKVVGTSIYSDMAGYYMVNKLSSGKTRVVCWFDQALSDVGVGDTITVIGLCRIIDEEISIVWCQLYR